MKWFIGLVLFVCLVGVKAQPSNVVVLTDDNFDEVTSEGSWLIKFYAPWCGHCKKLLPVFDEASMKLAGKLRLGKLDCTTQTKTASRFNIKSYPTLKFKRGDEMRPYTGGRSLHDFVDFAEHMSLPPVIYVAKLKQMRQALQGNANTNTYVLFAPSKSPAATNFYQIASIYQGLLKFVQVPTDIAQDTDISQIRDHYINKQDSSSSSKNSPPQQLIVISAGYDNPRPQFDGAFEEMDELRAFVDQYRYPLISELDASNFEELTSVGTYLVLLIVEPNSPSKDPFLKAMYPVAKYFRGKLHFASVDGVKFSKYVEQFGIRGSMDLPTVTVLDYPDYYYSPRDFVHEKHSPFIITPADDESSSPSSSPSARLAPELTSQFLTGVLEGRVPSTGTIPWYHPARYVKMAERALSQLSMPALIAVTLIGVVLLLTCIFGVCKCLGGFDDDLSEELQAAAVTAGSGSGSPSSNAGGAGAGAAGTAATVGAKEQEDDASSSASIRKRNDGKKPRRAD